METRSILNNRCIIHRACRFLAVTWASDAQELCATPGQGDGAGRAAGRGFSPPACLLSLPHVQMGTWGLRCLVSVDTG
jgi:hypothetical protein